jgi:hypothetical protein
VKENFITTFWLAEAISENPAKNDEIKSIFAFKWHKTTPLYKIVIRENRL